MCGCPAGAKDELPDHPVEDTTMWKPASGQCSDVYAPKGVDYWLPRSPKSHDSFRCHSGTYYRRMRRAMRHREFDNPGLPLAGRVPLTAH